MRAPDATRRGAAVFPTAELHVATAAVRVLTWHAASKLRHFYLGDLCETTLFQGAVLPVVKRRTLPIKTLPAFVSTATRNRGVTVTPESYRGEQGCDRAVQARLYARGSSWRAAGWKCLTDKLRAPQPCCGTRRRSTRGLDRDRAMHGTVACHG